MVDDYRTDDEQIEAIKNWWNENGRSTVVTIVLAIAGVVGWQQWQDSRQQSRQNAAQEYQELLDAVQAPEKTASQLTTAEHLAGGLKEKYSSSTYAHFAALHMAKLHVEQDQLASAREQLQWILDNGAPDPAITSLARLRLARVVLAESGAEQALSLIENVEAGAYRSSYAEFKGDLYDELGKLDLAEQQYGLAKESASAAAGAAANANPLLEMKYKSAVRRLAKNSPAAEVQAAAELQEAGVSAEESPVDTLVEDSIESVEEVVDHGAESINETGEN